MNLLHLPLLELAIAITLLGSPCVSGVRNPERAYRWGVAIIGASFGCTVLAWLAFYVGVPPESLARFSPKFQGHLVGIPIAINDLLRSRLPVSGYILINLSASVCKASASVTWWNVVCIGSPVTTQVLRERVPR